MWHRLPADDFIGKDANATMKIVFAYSGGLDTSVILRWLKDNYSVDIVAFCADIGQEDELDGLEQKALKTGATKCIIDDLREEFARDFIFPMFQADAIAHGATGKGNDQVRFELTAAALAPKLKVIAPWREEPFRKQFPGRKEMIAFAKKNKIQVEASAEKPYSMDRNLLHISFEGGILEDPWFDASSPEMRGMYKLSVAPEDAPDKPEHVDLAFENGDCVNVAQASRLRSTTGGTRAVASQNLGADSAAPSRMSPLGVMQMLNKLGGKHGIGRVDIVENRFVGMKGRGVYETPGGAILHFAHRQMESLTMDREVMHLRDSLFPKYGELVLQWLLVLPGTRSAPGFHHRDAARCHRPRASKTLQGKHHRRRSQKVRKVCTTLKSPQWGGEKSTYDQSDATGFIRLNALRLKLRAALKPAAGLDCFR